MFTFSIAKEEQEKIDGALRDLHREKMESNKKISQRLEKDYNLVFKFVTMIHESIDSF